MMHNAKAIYAGSFDPITNGHLWMIRTAEQLFNHLIVAVANNSDKQYTFSLAQRCEMLNQTLLPLGSKVQVEAIENEFLMHFAKSKGISFIVRGIRNSADYEFEKAIKHINYDLDPNIETIFLMPPRDFAEVSSSLVKGLVGIKGWEEVILKYVPAVVLEKLLLLRAKSYN